MEITDKYAISNNQVIPQIATLISMTVVYMNVPIFNNMTANAPRRCICLRVKEIAQAPLFLFEFYAENLCVSPKTFSNRWKEI